LLLISFQSRAFYFSKASTKTEKLICKEDLLVDMDKEYNSIYNEVVSGLSSQDMEVLKSKITNLMRYFGKNF
jgi:uncharacterized protein